MSEHSAKSGGPPRKLHNQTNGGGFLHSLHKSDLSNRHSHG